MGFTMKILLLHVLTATLFVAGDGAGGDGTVYAGDYVRPPPRKTVNFPWDPKPPSQPQQVHISLAGDKYMRVTWVTDDGSSPSIVEYGTSPRKYSAIAQGESTKYSYLLYSSGKIHHTVIGPLQKNTTYFYRCGGEGPEFQLKTPPSKFPVAFAVAGDLGQTGWESGSTSNLYYSFNVAGVHIIMLGSYTPFDEYSDQHSWLKADLLKVDCKRTPWLVVIFHVPWYNSNRAHQGEGDDMMAKHVYNGKSDRCGAVHITIGDGGNREGLAHRYKQPPPEWSVFREASFGHGELKMVNSTHAFWSWHRNEDDESVQSDQVWITSLFGSGCNTGGSHEMRRILMAS
ncbi:unnamed protein product [Withania somnifera]